MKFYRNYHLKKHMNTHTDVKSYCCDVCGSQFKSESDVVGHKNRTHGLFKWQCVECLQKFRDKAKAHKHVFIHSDLPSHGCTICGLELKNESQARRRIALEFGPILSILDYLLTGDFGDSLGGFWA